MTAVTFEIDDMRCNNLPLRIKQKAPSPIHAPRLGRGGSLYLLLPLALLLGDGALLRSPSGNGARGGRRKAEDELGVEDAFARRCSARRAILN